MIVLTDLGDLAILLPLAGLMLLWLLTLQPRSAAEWWLTAIELCVGLTGLSVFAWGYLRRKTGMVPLRPLILAAVLLVVFLYGHGMRAEEMLHAISAYLRIVSVFCQ